MRNKCSRYPDWRKSLHADRRHRPASLSHLARDCTMRHQHDHCLFWGLTPALKFTGRGGNVLPLRSNILPNFIALCQFTPDISIANQFGDIQTDRQTNKQVLQLSELAYRSMPTCQLPSPASLSHLVLRLSNALSLFYFLTLWG